MNEFFVGIGVAFVVGLCIIGCITVRYLIGGSDDE